MSKEELSKRTARLPMVDGERRGCDGGMYRVKWLQPLPIDFDPEAHQYTWKPTGEVMSHGVTTILRARKDPKTLPDFRGHQTNLGPQGHPRSSCLERFLQGTPMDELLGGPYDEWVRPLLEYPLWETFEPIALEYSVCDIRRNIGGSLDVLELGPAGCDGPAGSQNFGPQQPPPTHAQLGRALPQHVDRSPQAGGGQGA